MKITSFGILVIASLFSMQLLAQQKNINSVEVDTFEITEEIHSPIRAALLSAAVPGLGQIYNGKYWKLPILYGGTAGLIYGINLSNSKYKFWREAYYDATSGFFNDDVTAYFINNNQEFYLSSRDPFSVAPEFQKRKNDWKKRRDYNILGLAALYLFNVVDAHVDAYFLDFNVDEDISLRVRPYVDNYFLSENFIGLKLSLDYK